MELRRRDVLRDGWKLGGVLLFISAGWTAFESLRPLPKTGIRGPVKVGNVSRFQPGTATYVPEGRLYVTNNGQELLALSQKCPHLGCRVPFCDSSGRFECACHGSVYTLDGTYVQGPSPRGMDRYPVSLDGADLVADTSKTIEGPPRGSGTVTPPKGPSCVPGA